MSSGFSNVPPTPQRVTDNLLGGNIGGIVSTRPQAKYVSGARTILRINGKIVGFAFAVSWQISTMYREVETIDNPIAEELVPMRIKVDGSISALHIPGLGPGAQLWQPDALSFVFHQYITIEVKDSVTDELLFYAPKAVITSRREEVRVDSLAQVSLSFMAIGFRDEKVPSYPENVDTLSKPSTSVSKLGDHVSARDYEAIDLSSSASPTTAR
jgi:hypothetical protein